MSVFLGSGAIMFAFVAGTTVAVGLFGLDFLDDLLGREDDPDADEPGSTIEEDDDPFEAFEDEWDDDWLDDDEPSTTEVNLEPRIDNLEDEVDRLGSTVGSVRSENEELAATVDEIEENVRKLLEIYEVVSREANPFVGEAPGLSSGKEPHGVDTTAANDGLDWMSEELPVDEASDILGGMERAGGIQDTGPADSNETMTFEDLKAEYEEAAAPDSDESAEGVEPHGEADSTAPKEKPSGDDFDWLAEDEPDESTGPVAPEPETAKGHHDPEPANLSETDNGAAKPYLKRLPAGYMAELVILEWVDFLRQSAEMDEVLWTIDYYQRIDWIGEPVAEQLRTVVDGLSTDTIDGGPPDDGSITVEDHKRSLEFISRLDGDPLDLGGIEPRLGE